MKVSTPELAGGSCDRNVTDDSARCRTEWFIEAVDAENRVLLSSGRASCAASAVAMPRMPRVSEKSVRPSPLYGSSVASAVEACGDYASSLTSLRFSHRDKMGGAYPFFSCVARPVAKKVIESTPAAQAAMRTEWDKLAANSVFDMSSVREWSSVRAESRRTGTEVHHGSLATIVVEEFGAGAGAQ